MTSADIHVIIAEGYCVNLFYKGYQCLENEGFVHKNKTSVLLPFDSH